jgi:hypothetical protein
MHRRTRLALSPVTLGLAALAVNGCGSSDSVVHFKGAPHASISKATLDHWMRSIVGSDFRISLAAEGPTGLVSEPANYPQCIDSAKLVARRSMFNQLQLSRTRIDQICHQLYRSIQAQTLSFLISAQWTTAEAAQAHISVTNREVTHDFDQTRPQRFPTEQDLHKYEAERQLSLADLLYQAKIDALVSKLLPRFQQQLKQAGGSEQAYVKLALAHDKDLISRTSCTSGYVVAGCSQYRETPGSTPPAPNIILTELAGKQPS